MAGVALRLRGEVEGRGSRRQRVGERLNSSPCLSDSAIMWFAQALGFEQVCSRTKKQTRARLAAAKMMK